MDVKLIVTDLDRTLLHTDKTVSDYTVDVLRRCQLRGIKTAFATARSEESSKRFTALFTPDIMISNGGAIVRMGNAILHSCVLPRDTVNVLISRMLGNDSVGYITVDTPMGYFVNHPIDENHVGWQDYLHAKYIDFSKVLDFDAYKLTAQFFDSSLPKKIAEDLTEVDVLAFSDDNWVRFANTNAVKWTSVAKAALHIGIDTADIVAFGDDYNDLEMLCECGTGIAVSNAIGEVKAIADYICGTNDEDGVAKWLEENLL